MAAQRAKVAGTQLLCRYYRVRVMSIHEDRFDERILLFCTNRHAFAEASDTIRNSPLTGVSYIAQIPGAQGRKLTRIDYAIARRSVFNSTC